MRTRIIATLLTWVPACGGGGVDIDGPYVQVLGTPGKVFSISSENLDVYCRSSAISSSFDFDASTTEGVDTGDYFRFSIFDYKGSGDYDIVYGQGYSSKVEVGFDKPDGAAGAKGYKYWFFQNHSSGAGQLQASRCQLSIEDKSGDGTTRASGSMSCVLLWAHQDSADYGSGAGNPYVDLNARFACE
jgi:hypothetical protein